MAHPLITVMVVMKDFHLQIRKVESLNHLEAFQHIKNYKNRHKC